MNILINKALSMSYFGQQPYEPEIVMILDEMELSIDDFRTSQRLRRLLQQVVTVLLNEKKIFPSSGSHFVTIRLEMMTSLLVGQLCTPHLYDLLGVGARLKHALSGLWNHATEEAKENNKNNNNNSNEDDKAKEKQNDFILRAKGVFLEAFSLIKLYEDALVTAGCDFGNTDERLSYLLLNLLDFRTSAILPDVMTLRQYGYEALEKVTCYLLSITATSEILKQSIRGVINRMSDELTDERLTNSTFAANIPALTRCMMQYFQYLRRNAVALIKDSRKDEIIKAVNPNLRHALKNENYESPTDAIAIYQQRYRQQLTHLSIPLQAYSMEDIRQARKDILRDRVSLNKVLYCSDRNGDVCEAVREEIRKVLVFSLGVDRPELFEESSTSTKKQLFSGELSSRPSFSFTAKDEPASSASSVQTKKEPPPPLNISSSLDDSLRTPLKTSREDEDSPPGLMRRSSVGPLFFSDETEAFLRKKSNNSSLTTCFSSPNVSFRNASSNAGTTENEQVNLSYMAPSAADSIFYFLPQQLQNNEYFYADILSILQAYTTLAASRTFAGGDAFIILNDLYGGEGLTLCPYKQSHGCFASATPSPVRPLRKAWGSKADIHGMRENAVRNEEASDVQIAIKSSGIKVVVKERYQLFSSYDLQSCCDPSELQALMCFECTTTTLIILCSERIAAIPLDLQNISSSAGFHEHEKAYRLFQLLITNPHQICHRAVSIEPFIA